MNAIFNQYCKVFGLTSALFVIGIAMAPAEASGQETPKIQKEAGAAAISALQKTMDVVRRTKSYSLMGLESAAESKDAKLGTPIPVKEIGYDRLVKYEEGRDPQSVFVGPEQALYPVMVKNQVRSSLIMVRKETGWETVSYGDAGRTTAIERTRATLAKETGAKGGEEDMYALVVVPAFQLYMVARTQGGRTLLKPVNAEVAEELGLKGIMEEQEVIDRLSAYAKEFEGKYGEAIRQKRLVR